MPSIPDLPINSTKSSISPPSSAPSSPRSQTSSVDSPQNSSRSTPITAVAKSVLVAASSVNTAAKLTCGVSVLPSSIADNISRATTSDDLVSTLKSSSSRTQTVWQKMSFNFGKMSDVLCCSALLIALQTGNFDAVGPAFTAASLMEIPGLIDKTGELTSLCKNLHQVYSLAGEVMVSGEQNVSRDKITKALAQLIANSKTSSAISSKRNTPSSQKEVLAHEKVAEQSNPEIKSLVSELLTKEEHQQLEKIYISLRGKAGSLSKNRKKAVMTEAKSLLSTLQNRALQKSGLPMLKVGIKTVGIVTGGFKLKLPCTKALSKCAKAGIDIYNAGKNVLDYAKGFLGRKD